MDSQIDDESPATGAARCGLALVRKLLSDHPAAAVAIIDPATRLGDARAMLAAAGLDIGSHTMLRGTAAAEFVAPTEARLVGGAIGDAGDHGQSERAVHLRDGRAATLHFIRVDELHLPTGFVMVIVPESDGFFAEAPAPVMIEPAARVAVLCVDGGGTVRSVDDAAVSMLGRTRDELVGDSIVSWAHPGEEEASVAHWVAAKENRGVAHVWRSRVKRGDGSFFWTELSMVNRIDDAGSGDVRVELHDISREMAAIEALAVERSLLKSLTEALPVGVAKFDAEGRIEYSNAQLALLLERDPAEILAGVIGGEFPGLAEAFSRLFRKGRASTFVTGRSRLQPDRALEWTLRPVTSAAGVVTGGVLCVADVTEATDLRAALEHRATTDALTGCLNWAGTINCLQAALRSAGSSGIGLLFIDLNGFKGINDRHGHAIGDRVLELVALRLRDAVRPFDKIGRLGGDEFVVVAPGLASVDATRVLAERVSADINRLAIIAGLRINISASVGVAWADSGDADVLLAEADRAMYLAKSTAPALAPENAAASGVGIAE
jgi:diguanylate cyclase (GGDEF)-like protein/PAS domain S-box-containing protein